MEITLRALKKEELHEFLLELEEAIREEEERMSEGIPDEMLEALDRPTLITVKGGTCATCFYNGATGCTVSCTNCLKYNYNFQMKEKKERWYEDSQINPIKADGDPELQSCPTCGRKYDT